MWCSNCGAALALNARFCSACGTQVAVGSAPAHPPGINHPLPSGGSQYNQSKPDFPVSGTGLSKAALNVLEVLLLIVIGLWILNNTRLGTEFKCRVLGDQWACLEVDLTTTNPTTNNPVVNNGDSQTIAKEQPILTAVDTPPIGSVTTTVNRFEDRMAPG